MWFKVPETCIMTVWQDSKLFATAPGKAIAGQVNGVISATVDKSQMRNFLKCVQFTLPNMNVSSTLTFLHSGQTKWGVHVLACTMYVQWQIRTSRFYCVCTYVRISTYSHFDDVTLTCSTRGARAVSTGTSAASTGPTTGWRSCRSAASQPPAARHTSPSSPSRQSV